MRVSGYDSIKRSVVIEEGDAMVAERKEPNWPDWVDDVFTAEGIRLLAMAYDHAKNSGLERSKKVSAEDLATAAAACWLVAGRTDLLRRIP